jgi:hypothetical protein
MPGKVVLAGGNGYIGKRLSRHLSNLGYEIVVLSRQEAGCISWDGRNLGPWTSELEGALAVVNLAGVSVSKPWTEANRLAIFESRVESTRVLGKAIAGLKVPPKVWVNSSAIGYYGDRGDEILTESSPAGAKGNFLANLCVAWEDEVDRAATPQTRKVKVRTGVVFGQGSLAFEPLRKAVLFFAGGQFGNGRQYMSWIHVHDLVRLMQWAIESELSGAVNATASEPVQSFELMATMRAVMRRPWCPPVPAFVLKVISFLGGPDSSLLLESQRAIPAAAAASGFVFDYPRLREALVDLMLPQATSTSFSPG